MKTLRLMINKIEYNFTLNNDCLDIHDNGIAQSNQSISIPIDFVKYLKTFLDNSGDDK